MTTRQKVSGRARLYLLMAFGAVLVGVALTLVSHNSPAVTDAGALPVVSTSASPTTSAATPAPAVRSTVSSPAVPMRSERAGTAAPSRLASSSRGVTTDRPPAAPSTTRPPVAAAPLGRPTVLHLPNLQVDASVDPVDSVKGVLQVPDDIARVGWWQHSAAPGSSVGSTVLDGHIDSAVTGQGALFHLADMNPGDPISLSTTTGTIHYRVQARRVYVKEEGLPADVFDQQGPGRLVLISCGGPFDSSIRSYQDNIVVFATRTG